MFPEAMKEDSDLVLRYRDSHCLEPSDQELQEVLSSAGGAVLKFYLHKLLTERGTTRVPGLL